MPPPEKRHGTLPPMRIALGTDEVNPTTESLVAWLEERGHRVVEVARGEDWPVVGRRVAEAVVSGGCDRGVACCTTGTGVSIAANKVPGARAALCVDAATAAGARRWNDANIVALGLRLTTPALAAEILDAFLTTELDASESALVDQVEGDPGR